VPRPTIWTTIADTLAGEIAAGRYAAGDRLPSEALLAARFGVNRHTLRRAVAALAARGLVASRRGAGVFVAQGRRLDYPLGRRVRFHATVAAQGATPGRTVQATETRRADLREAAALALAPGDAVHSCEGISHADGVPIALFRSVFPAARFPGLTAALAGSGSVTRALAECGLSDYTRAETRLEATTADPTQALRLRLAEGAPLLHSIAVNVDPSGAPVEYGETWFAGDRVTLRVAPE
jgi:GntR family phosphonate transport system transcriptional regulator